jgi:succinoglycan biosynthesis transport protein ExoP
VEVKESLAPLMKWWWLILATVLIAAISSMTATRQQLPIYQTRTTLMVGRAMENPNPSNAEFGLTQQLAATYADIAKRKPVRDATMQALGLNRLPDYMVRVVPNTQLLEITVADTDPERAQAVANELANQLIRQSPMDPQGEEQQRQEFIDRQLSQLEASIAETEQEITRKQEELAKAFSARQIADIESQLAGLHNKLNTLQANYAALLANTRRGAINTIRVIEPAILPTNAVGPDRRATLLLALAFGFLLSTGAAYLLEHLDDTIREPADVHKGLGLTILGTVPGPTKRSSGNNLLAFSGEPCAATEAYRVLRVNLQSSLGNPSPSLWLMTSPLPTKSKSATVANLSIALAQAGQHVILVDADLYQPQLHQLFQIRNDLGLTTMLSQDSQEVEKILQETRIPNLRVLTSGPLLPNPAQLLDSIHMRELLTQLRAQADIIILDSPPATASADAIALSTLADHVLLIFDIGRTRREPVRKVLQNLRQVHAPVSGVLLIDLSDRESNYFDNNYVERHLETSSGALMDHPERLSSRGIEGSPISGQSVSTSPPGA